MKASDYIVDFLVRRGITDVFGYPGGMVTHLMDSLGKKEQYIKTHITYHEQAAAFAACGYAQSSDKVGVAFATSGPGATNLITGIGNAYFDSIPTVFITGQVNTFESKGNSNIRQKGFQETSIVPMVKEITKESFYVSHVNELPEILSKAFAIANEGRKGPVLIDIPMNIFRSEIDVGTYTGKEYVQDSSLDDCNDLEVRLKEELGNSLSMARRPCLLLGNGIKIDHQIDNIRGILRVCPMPVVTSMISVDIIPEGQELEGLYYGFIGAYGNRTANFVVAKSDLLICMGTRLDVRQVGAKREQFAPNAKIIRIDIDSAELENCVHFDESGYKLSLSKAIPIFREIVIANKFNYNDWLGVCKNIKKNVKYIDEREPNRIINAISRLVPDGDSIVADVGQHMVWVAQSFKMKPNQRAYFSGGMGSMGYSLPAAIGIYYSTKRPVFCFVGDGGLQMNIQELQFLVRENIPIKIIIMDNSALGMIRHFQEMYFESNYYYTIQGNGYSVPDFEKIAKAYGIESCTVNGVDEIDKDLLENSHPALICVKLKGDTYVFPKLEYGKPNQDQEPLLDRELYNYLNSL